MDTCTLYPLGVCSLGANIATFYPEIRRTMSTFAFFCFNKVKSKFYKFYKFYKFKFYQSFTRLNVVPHFASSSISFLVDWANLRACVLKSLRARRRNARGLIKSERIAQNSETHLASWYLPVTSNKPLSAIKVSLPQQRMKPVEKWGKPAASDVKVGIAAPDDGP